MTAEKIVQTLGLQPHPEGGFYRETYRSKDKISGVDRTYSTAIFYLLTPGNFSRIHRLRWDEIFHFYLGDPVTWLLLHPNGKSERVTLGTDLARGEVVQLVIPAGTWFGGYLNEGGSYGLMGTTVAPGFEFSDLEFGKRAELVKKYPEAQRGILRLTKES